jgi:NTP pyrophosphatase (non-canonical NTP hydrolase)
LDELKAISKRILAFRDKRSWSQFHTPRHLAAALSIEAAELQEALLWKSDKDVYEFVRSKKGNRILLEEIADVLILSLLFCDATGIEPIKAIKTKLKFISLSPAVPNNAINQNVEMGRVPESLKSPNS